MNSLKDEILNLLSKFIGLEPFEIEEDDNFMGFGQTILFKKILRDKYKLSHDTEEMTNIYNKYQIFDIYEEYKEIPCINCYSYIMYIKNLENQEKWNWLTSAMDRMKIYLYNLKMSCHFLENKEEDLWINRLYIHKSFLTSLYEIELYLKQKEDKVHNEIKELNLILDKVDNLLLNSESDKKTTPSPTMDRITYEDFYFLTCTEKLRDFNLRRVYNREKSFINKKFRLQVLEDLEKKKLSSAGRPRKMIKMGIVQPMLSNGYGKSLASVTPGHQTQQISWNLQPK